MHVLIVGSAADDPTAASVATRLHARGIPYGTFDSSSLGTSESFTEDLSEFPAQGQVDRLAADVVWFRRLSPPAVTFEITDLRERYFAQESWFYAIYGHLPDQRRWVNRVWNHRSANDKVGSCAWLSL